jgi:hypothetical protein
MKLTGYISAARCCGVGNRKKGHIFINERTGKRLTLRHFEKMIDKWARLLNIQRRQSIQLSGRQSFYREVIFLIGIELYSLQGWRLAQSEIISLLPFCLQKSASLIDDKSCGLAVDADVYIQADMFIKVHSSSSIRAVMFNSRQIK